MSPRTLALAVAIAAAFAAAGASGQKRHEPAPLGIDSLAGADSYAFYCASCHGRAAKGDGPLAPALTKHPTDLTTLARWNGGVFPRETLRAYVTGIDRPIESHGPPDMPVWGPIFRSLDPSDARVAQRITNLLDYLESIQAK
jgi:hypothetical protein